MLASAAAFTDNPATAPVAARRGVDGGGMVVVPLFLATVFLFFVAYQLFGAATGAAVMVLVCAVGLAARNVTITPGFPFLRRLSLGEEEGRGGGGGGDGDGDGVARPAAGMDAAAIMALPAAFGYKRDHQAAVAAAGWAQCSICLGLARVGDAVRRLPSCGHLFHAGCVDEWLRAHATCPLCRAAVCAAGPELPV